LKAQNYYLNNDVVDVEMGVVLNVVVDYVVSRGRTLMIIFKILKP